MTARWSPICPTARSPTSSGYFDMFIVAGAIPILANIVAIILGTIGIV